MAKDDKKTKAGPPPKTEIAAKKKDEAAPKDKAVSGAEPAKIPAGSGAGPLRRSGRRRRIV